jgi:hypothetical protein
VIPQKGSQMHTGQYVRLIRGGRKGRLVDLSDPVVVTVELGDGRTQTWRRDEIALFRERGPRGVLRPNDRMLSLAREYSSGDSLATLAERYGISVHTVHAWIAKVRDATEDAMNMAASGQ